MTVMILSGDIVNTSTPEEYSAAAIFLRNLCDEFKVSRECVIIVPGNHDLNWKLAEHSYKILRKGDYDGSLDENVAIDNGEYVEIRDEDEYRKRFQ